MALAELQALREALEQGRITQEELNEASRGLIDTNDNQRTASEALTDATMDSIGSLANFTKSVSGSSGDMGAISGVVRDLSGALGDAIPFVGGLAKGLGEVTAFAIDRLQASFSSFQDLADAGAIGAEGIEGLREDFDAAGIPLEKYSAMLKSNSEDLSFVFGSALKGSDQFSGAMKTMMDGSNDQLRNMGFTVEEVGDTVVNFQKLQNRLGFSQEMSQEQLAKSATAYGTELDLLSKLTGESKDQLQSERDARMLDARYRATLLDMSKEEAEATRKFMALQKSLGPEMEKQAMAALTGMVTSADGIKGELSGVGPVVRDFRQSIKDGDYSTQNMIEHTKAIGEAQGKFAKDQKGYFLARGDDDGVFTSFAGMLDAQVRAGKMSVEQAETILDAQDKQKNQTDDTTAAFVDAQANIMRTAVNLDLLSTDVTFATEAVDFFATGMVTVTNKLREMIGVSGAEDKNNVTAKLALRGEEDIARKDAEEASAELAHARRMGASDTELLALEQIRDEKKAEYKVTSDRIKILDKLNTKPFMQQRDLIKQISDGQRDIILQEREINKVQQEYRAGMSKVAIDKKNVYTDDEKGEAEKAVRIAEINKRMEDSVKVMREELELKKVNIEQMKEKRDKADVDLEYADYAFKQQQGRAGLASIESATPVSTSTDTTAAPTTQIDTGDVTTATAIQRINTKKPEEKKEATEKDKETQAVVDEQVKIATQQTLQTEELTKVLKDLAMKMGTMADRSAESVAALSKQIMIAEQQLREAKKTTEAVQ